MPNSEPIHQFVATGYITQLPHKFNHEQFNMHIDTLKQLEASDESKSDINKEYTIKISNYKIEELYKLGNFIENQNMTHEQKKELYLFQNGIQFAKLLMTQWYIGKRITLKIIGLKDGVPQKDDMIHDLERIEILYNSYPIVEINQSNSNSRENTIDLCQQYFIEIREIPQSEQPNLTTAKYMYERLEKEQEKQQETEKKNKKKQTLNYWKTLPQKLHAYMDTSYRGWALIFVLPAMIVTFILGDIFGDLFGDLWKYIKEIF